MKDYKIGTKVVATNVVSRHEGVIEDIKEKGGEYLYAVGGKWYRNNEITEVITKDTPNGYYNRLTEMCGEICSDIVTMLERYGYVEDGERLVELKGFEKPRVRVLGEVVEVERIGSSGSSVNLHVSDGGVIPLHNDVLNIDEMMSVYWSLFKKLT